VALRILANENVPAAAVEALRSYGHDVVWASTCLPGRSDDAILAQAQEEERIVATFDKDFGELAFRWGLPASCGVILFRAKTQSPHQASALVLRAIGTRSDWAGHFSVVESDRIRVRPLPRTTKEGQ